MLVRQYSGEQRRALNIIWNAAEDYGAEPYFMAFSLDGSADFYMNTVVGLVMKYYDREKLYNFFDRVASFIKRDEFDDLLWLGLESSAYGRGSRERMALSGLRQEHGELFFKDMYAMSKQQMMLQSMLTFDQHEARWAEVTGRRKPVLTPREQRIRDALLFPGDLDTDGVINAMDIFLKEFFKADVFGVSPGNKGKKRSGLGRLFHLGNDKNKDRLIVRTGALEDPKGRLRKNGQRPYGVPSSEERQKDLDYIEKVFGNSIIPEPEMKLIRDRLLRHGDRDAEIFFGGGHLHSEDQTSAEIKDALLQGQRNRKYLEKNAQFISASKRRLRSQFEAVFSSYAEPLPEESTGGSLDVRLSYRLPVLKDTHVFLRPGDEREKDISVMLLLDASTSRMNTQEIIASQSLVISDSLEKCEIPVAVASFRSIRGITVLQVLKDFDDRGTAGIPDYFAGGWNRDSLGLGAAAYLMDRYDLRSGGMRKKHLLMVLTDASPNDSVPVSSDRKGGPLRYEGENGVLETTDAVSRIRSAGTTVSAIFYGSGANIENLHRIYGNEYIRISSLSQISRGVSELVEKALREFDASDKWDGVNRGLSFS
ncbi:MAG: hypothetical protein K6E33_00140 [Lachnospiraceae bacterium]|nr:hypothetical protein [Lachnospiraceae bacterium]